MIAALLRKELRALRPTLLILLLLAISDLFIWPITKQLDELSWGSAVAGDLLPGEGSDSALTLLVICLILGYSLFPREHDEGSIDFLYGLPISRPQIFFSKLFAAWIVVAAFSALSIATALLPPLLLNQQNLSGGPIHPGLVASVFGLQLAFASIMLCHSLLLSFFRRFGFVILGLAFWAYLAARKLATETAWLNPAGLLSLEYFGQELIIPWPLLAIHGAAALLSLGLAYLLWMKLGESWFLDASWGRDTLRGRVFMGCGSFLIFALLISYGVYNARGDDDPDDEEPEERVVATSFATARAKTASYQFVYPSELGARARIIIRSAEAVAGRVAAALQAEKPKERIAVDLTDQSVGHAGIASWQTIRVGLQESDPAELLRTFSHETTHAFEFQLSKRRLSDNARATHFFAEGLAEYIALHHPPAPEALLPTQRLAAAAVLRHRIRFDELSDSGRMRARHDPNLAYPLGETWVEALVAVAGAEAPGRILRAMGRDDAPQDLSSSDFWLDTCRAAGVELEAVTARWLADLKRLAKRERAWIARLPRISGGVLSVKRSGVMLRVILDRPLPEGCRRVFIRLRDDPGASDSETATLETIAVRDEGRIRAVFVPRRLFVGRAIELQFGMPLPGRGLPWFEDWQRITLPR